MADEPEVGGGLDQMTKAELKGEARARGLRVSGTREELLRRVREHDTGAGGDGDERAAGGDGEPQPPEPGDEGTRGQDEEGEPVGEHDDEAGETATAAPERHGDEVAVEAAAREHAGDGRDGEHEGGGGHEGGGDGRPRAAGRLGELLETARTSIEQLVGQPVDSVSGVQATDGGFRVDVEVVEVSRIPPTTDVLATYQVDLDADGEVTGFTRTNRYYRNQTRDT
jgi:hypothetical protein